jgi:hypothetical protein
MKNYKDVWERRSKPPRGLQLVVYETIQEMLAFAEPVKKFSNFICW